MKRLLTPTPERVNTALLTLRVVTGLVMLMHGWRKVFQMGLSGVAQGFEGMGIPMAGIMGPAHKDRIEFECTAEKIVAVKVMINSPKIAGWNEIDAIGGQPCGR